jgi:hypothetical protein
VTLNKTTGRRTVAGRFGLKRRTAEPQLVRVVHDIGLGWRDVETIGERIPMRRERCAGALRFGPLEPPAVRRAKRNGKRK